MKKSYEHELNQYRLKAEKAQTDLIDDLDSKQNDLRQARLQAELLKSTKNQLEQAQDQNQRLTKKFFPSNSCRVLDCTKNLRIKMI